MKRPPSRRSIGDKDGSKSFYVIEAFYDGFGQWKGSWGTCSADPQRSYRGAVKEKQRTFVELLKFNKRWTLSRLRIRLYARVEG